MKKLKDIIEDYRFIAWFLIGFVVEKWHESFITNYTKNKCSQCGAIDQTKIIYRDVAGQDKRETILRCTECGHEKVISRISKSAFQKPAIYELQRKEFEEF